MLVKSEVINPAKEKNLVDGVVTITAECKLPDGRIIQALGKQSEVPIGIFCSDVFIDKLPVTLIAFPGSLDDPRVRYEIAPWSNQSEFFKAGLFSRLINITSQGFLENINWGEADTNLILDKSFRSQLENTFKNSDSSNKSSHRKIIEELFPNENNECIEELFPNENNECDENEDDDLKNFFEICKDVNNNKITYQDKSFPSISSLAKFLKISPQTLARRIRADLPEDKWGEKKNFEIKYLGLKFPSISTLAKFLGINTETLRYRINRGWSEDKWGEKR